MTKGQNASVKSAITPTSAECSEAYDEPTRSPSNVVIERALRNRAEKAAAENLGMTIKLAKACRKIRREIAADLRLWIAAGDDKIGSMDDEAFIAHVVRGYGEEASDGVN